MCRDNASRKSVEHPH